MIKKLTVIFILLSNISFAQPVGWYTAFDKFVISSSIHWASYVFDTVSIKNNLLNSLLLSRFQKNEIRGSLYQWRPPKDKTSIIYESKNDIDSIMFTPRRCMPILDSNGNEPPDVVYEKRKDPDIASITMTEIKQLLYIENGKLKSYVAWVSPMVPVITSMGVNLGNGGYFSTCFNFNRNYSLRKKDYVLSLSETRLVMYPDSLYQWDRVKELYGRNFIEILWPHIENGEFEVYITDTNTKLKKEEIIPYVLKKTAIPSPVYDSNGNITTAIEYVENSFFPKKITKTELVQDWYYNYRENIVFSKIRELYLYVQRPSSTRDNPETMQLLKIVFN